MNAKSANSVEALERELASSIKYVAAREPINRATILSELTRRQLDRWGSSRRSKTFLRLAKEFKERGRFDRLRAITLIGLTDLGEAFLSPLERTGAFIVRDQLRRNRAEEFLSRLAAEVDRAPAEWGPLPERLKTYLAFARFSRILGEDEAAAAALLSHRPRLLLKAVLAVANLAFLRKYLKFDLPQPLADRLELAGPPEGIASVVSALLALANHRATLDSFDLGAPFIGDLEDPAIWKLLDHGRALVEVHEVAQHISLLGYVLRESQTSSGPVFCLSGPTPEFEYSVRLGYMRGEIHRGPGPASLKDLPEMSMTTLAELFFHDFKDRILEVRDEETDFRRTRIVFPLLPGLADLVTAGFVDDVSEREDLMQEFMFPMRRVEKVEQGPFRLTATLTLNGFMKMWRMLRFMSLVDIAAIRSFVKKDYVTFVNSLVRVTKDQDTVELLVSLGFSAQEAAEFVSLVSASVSSFGYYDLQYRPFIHIAAAHLPSLRYQSPPETIHLSGLVATTSMLRNVQIANRIRFDDLPHVFVLVLSDLFKARFEHVIANRKIKAAEGETDIDLVVYTTSRIYLFECKHSVFPCGPHETRDIIEDIEKGTRQLTLARAALSSQEAQRRYLAQWFPDVIPLAEAELPISTAILCSQRVLCGIEWNGIPVRDYASLSKLLDDGTVAVTNLIDETGITMARFSLVGDTGFSSEDLDDYLSRESRYFGLYKRFMRPVCRLQRLRNLTLAHDSYLFDFASDEWQQYMEEIGARRLPDERHEMKPAKTWRDWVAERHDGEIGNRISEGSK